MAISHARPTEARPAPAPAPGSSARLDAVPTPDVGLPTSLVAPGRRGLDAGTLLRLQRAAGNRAVAGLVQSVQRDEPKRVPIAAGGGEGTSDEPAGPRAVVPPESGVAIDQLGVVDQDGTNPKKAKDGVAGLNLRPAPSTSNTPIGRLADRDHVLATRDMGGGWMYVIPTNGHVWGGEELGGALRGTPGYVKTNDLVDFHIPPNKESPDPGAFLYRIPSNKRAHRLVREVYGKGNIKTGQDQRFFTNVLKYVNDGAQRGSAFEVKEKVKRRGPISWVEEDIELNRNRQIWIPSLEMAQSLKGTVSRGSWERDVAEKVKGWLKTAAAVPAFIAGLAVGAIESIRDFFVGIFDFVWNAIKSLGKSLYDAGKAVYDIIVNEQKREEFFQGVAKELEDLVGPKVGFLRTWYNWGRIIGYATMEVVSTILLAGAMAAAKAGKFGARLAKVSEGVKQIPAIAKISDGANKLVNGPVGRRIAEVTRPAASAAKKTAAAVDVVTSAPAKAILGTSTWLAKRAAKLGRRFGWSSERLLAAAELINSKGVKLYLRRSSRHAPKRMAEGAIGKPMDIKANTLNEADLIIGRGFDKDQLGLVGHFEPLPPERWQKPSGMSERRWREWQPELKKRHESRAKAWEKLKGDMAELAKNPGFWGGTSYRVEGGLVIQVEHGMGGREIAKRRLTGDVDVFHATKADGSALGKGAVDDLDDRLLELDLTEHGFHSQWPGRGDYDPDVFYSIIEKHLDEPLIEVGPDLKSRQVRANQIPEIAAILKSDDYKAWKAKQKAKKPAAGASGGLPPALKSLDDEVKGRDPNARGVSAADAAGGSGWKAVKLKKGETFEAFGTADKTQFKWMARVTEEDWEWAQRGNQLVPTWYRDQRGLKPVKMVRYRITIREDTSAAMSRITDQTDALSRLGPAKFQYFHPGGFEKVATVERLNTIEVFVPEVVAAAAIVGTASAHAEARRRREQ